MSKIQIYSLFVILGPAALFVLGAISYASAGRSADAPPPADYAQCRDQAYDRLRACGVDANCNRFLRNDLDSCRYAFPETSPELAPDFQKPRR